MQCTAVVHIVLTDCKHLKPGRQFATAAVVLQGTERLW